MSRSYKKTPIWKEGSQSSRSFFKRQSNKETRRNKNLPNGGSYKKNGYSWHIHDYWRYETWQDRWSWCVSRFSMWGREEPNYEEEYQSWANGYYRK